MNIGIIGAGNVGSALARASVRAGHAGRRVVPSRKRSLLGDRARRGGDRASGREHRRRS
jgi:predicted dinucleotide-binding enzyme